MKTLLFINGSSCTSLEQLRDYFCTDLQSDKQLYEELLTLQRDGVLSSWLEEGSKEEKMLSNELDNIPNTISNSELMQKLICIFSNNKNKYLLSSSIETYTDIISYYIYSKNSDKYFGTNGNITILNKELEQSFFVLKLKVKKVDNEIFTIKAISKKEQCETNIHIQSYKIGEIISISLALPKIELGVQKIDIVSNSELICSFKINVVKDIQKYQNYDEYSSFRFGNAILGISTLDDFNCSNNVPVYYLGATLNFTDGVLTKISIPNNSEAFNLFTQSIDNTFYNGISFLETNCILKKYGFIIGKHSFSENKAMKLMSSSLNPSIFSLLLPGSAIINTARISASNKIKTRPGYAIYDDELIKETDSFVCVFKFHSGQCTGSHNLGIARTLPNTLTHISVHMK